MPRSTRPTPPPMTLEVIERRTFHVADCQVAEDLRQAIQTGDIERLADLIDFLNDSDQTATSQVLDYREVTR